MQTFLTFEHEQETEVPPEFEGDVRTPEAYVRRFLREFSDPGDVVLDPFAGFGTTLVVAEELDRAGYGIEYEADRGAVARDRIERDERVIRGSALELADYDLPTFDCCLTSPPYMERTTAVDPFRNYADDSESSYERYLDDLRDVFDQLRDLAADDAAVLVDVANMKYEGDVTRLAWDVADAAAASFHFDGEIVVGWEGEGYDHKEGTYGYGYDHSYCLVFGAE
ncbi:DNA methylase [Halobacteriales archaeon QS_1_67_19]|nr:MAG: DNA methylase [Halobacteriales archaeon QS_1_67_19]